MAALDSDDLAAIAALLLSGGVRLADAVVHGGATATLRLGAAGSTPALYVTNSNGDAVKFQSTGGNGNGMGVLGNGYGNGAYFQADSGGGGAGVYAYGDQAGLIAVSNQDGILATGYGEGYAGMRLTGGNQAFGLYVQGTQVGNNRTAAVRIEGGGFGSSSSGPGMIIDDNNGGAGALILNATGIGPAAIIAARNGDAIRLNPTDGDGIAIIPALSSNLAAHGISVVGAGTGAAVQFGDGTAGAESLRLLAGTGDTNADGVAATGAGTGVGIRSTPAAVGFGGGTVDANVVSVNGTTFAGPAIPSDRVMLSGMLGDQSLGNVDHVVLPFGPTDNGVLIGSRLRINSGIAQYQERTITSWVGADKIAGIDQSFVVGTPVSGNTFLVLYDHSYQLDGANNVNAIATVSAFQAAALAQLFTINTGQVYIDAVSGSIVKEIASSGLVITGQIAASPTPLASGFTVTLDSPTSAIANDFIGLYCTFLSGVREPTAKKITGCVVNTSTSLALTFAISFAGAPTATNIVAISS